MLFRSFVFSCYGNVFVHVCACQHACRRFRKCVVERAYACVRVCVSERVKATNVPSQSADGPYGAIVHAHILGHIRRHTSATHHLAHPVASTSHLSHTAPCQRAGSNLWPAAARGLTDHCAHQTSCLEECILDILVHIGS